MSLDYLDNIYKARKNKAATKLSGLKTWLLAHDANLKAKRLNLTDLHAKLIDLTRQAVSQADCHDLKTYAPYTALLAETKLAEQDFNTAVKQACAEYCQRQNYALYECSLCLDRGHIELQSNTEIETTPKQIACPNCFPKLCRQYLQSLNLWQINHSNQDDNRLEEPVLDIYRLKNSAEVFTEQKDNYEMNYKYALRFSENIIQAELASSNTLADCKDNLFISGAAGSGKSYLAAKIAEYVLRHGVLAIYITADSLADLFKQQEFLKTSYAPDLRQLDYVKTCFSLIYQAPLLVIDDLAVSNLQVPHLLKLFNQLGAKQHLVLTTNLSADDIVQTYGERILSRLLYRAEPIDFLTADLRLGI